MKKNLKKEIKVLSLFDGISCARVALDKLGYKKVTYYSSEIDKYAIQIAQKNWPDTIQLGSVIGLTRWKPKDNQLDNIDLLIGGSPCQDLSIAKKGRKGLAGDRSGLFYEYVRILNEVKPKYFILENVNSMPKEAKETITKELFDIAPIMINAALVSAQNRKRLFWVGKLNSRGGYEKVEIPLPEDRGIYLKDILEKDVSENFYVYNEYNKRVMKDKCGTLGTTMGRTAKQGYQVFTTKRIGHIGNGGQGDRIYSPDGKSVALSANGGGGGAKTGLYMIQDKKVRVRKYPVDIEKLKTVLQNHKNLTNKEISEKLNQPQTLIEHWFRKDNSFAIPNENIWFELKKLLNINTIEFDKSIMEWQERNGVFDQSKRVYIGNKIPTLQTGQQPNCLIENIVRKLTPIECERLQSLPDNYTDGQSNAQRYKACGNAFNVDVVAHILKNMV